MTPLVVAWAPLYQLAIKGMPCRHACPQSSLMEDTALEVPSSWMCESATKISSIANVNKWQSRPPKSASVLASLVLSTGVSHFSGEILPSYLR